MKFSGDVNPIEILVELYFGAGLTRLYEKGDEESIELRSLIIEYSCDYFAGKHLERSDLTDEEFIFMQLAEILDNTPENKK